MNKTPAFKKYLPDGFKILKYTGYRQKTLLECDQGHTFETSPKNTVFNCPTCKPQKLKEAKVSDKKLEWVKEELSKYNFKYISGDISDLNNNILQVECIECSTLKPIVFRHRKRRKCLSCKDNSDSKKLEEDIIKKVEALD